MADRIAAALNDAPFADGSASGASRILPFMRFPGSLCPARSRRASYPCAACVWYFPLYNVPPQPGLCGAGGSHRFTPHILHVA